MNTLRSNCAPVASSDRHSKNIVRTVPLLIAQLATLACHGSSSAPAQVILAESHFDSSMEGWTVSGDPAAGYPRWEPTMGCTPGCIRTVDAQQGLSMEFVAPPEFLGDKSAAYDGVFRYCIRNNEGSNQSTDSVLRMEGAGMRLVCRAAWAGTNWQTVVIDLNESATPPNGEWYVGDLSGRRPTRCEFRAVLASLASLKVDAEYRFGPDDVRFDDVSLESCARYAPPALCGVSGDLNCDGFLTVADISGFVLILTDAAAYHTIYPDCLPSAADVNCDGFASVADIGPFVDLLTGG